MIVQPTVAPDPIPIGTVDQWGRVWDGRGWRCPVGIPEAPQDGRYWGRNNGSWQLVVGALNDNAIGDFTVGGNLTVWKNIYGQENFYLVGDANIGGTMTANEAVINGLLTVEGGADIGGGCHVNDYLNVGTRATTGFPASGQGTGVVLDENGNIYGSNLISNGTATTQGPAGESGTGICLDPSGTLFVSTQIDVGANPNIMNLTSNGLYVMGTGVFGQAVSAAGVVLTSDRRHKSNIRAASEGLEALHKLRARRFVRQQREELGLIAQDVEAVLPDAVRTISHKNVTPHLGIDLGAMIAVLVNAVNDLADDVAALKARK